MERRCTRILAQARLFRRQSQHSLPHRQLSTEPVSSFFSPHSSSPDKMTAPTNIDPKDIQAHLAQFKGDKYRDGWASLWDKGDNLPWDKGFPNPALEDALVQRRATIGGAIGQDAQGHSYRRKALVPGCGRGVDVLLLASFGFDAYGLEYSATAIEACKKEQAENHSWYRVRDQSIGQGNVTFIQGDFFDDAWLQKIGVALNGFDIIYDYTVSHLQPLLSYNHFHFLQLPRVGYTAWMEGHDADPALSQHLFMLVRTRLTLTIVLLCPRPFYAA